MTRPKPVQRPGDGGCGCARTVGLWPASELCEPAVQADSTRVGRGRGVEGGGDLDCSAVARAALGDQAEAAECRPAAPAAAGDTHVHSGAAVSDNRAASEHGMDAMAMFRHNTPPARVIDI